MPYAYQDLQDLRRLQNVQEYARAAREVWDTAVDQQKAQIAADLNRLWQDAGRWIDDDFYASLPSELQLEPPATKIRYQPSASEVGAAWGLFAADVAGRPRGTVRRFRVSEGFSDENPKAFQHTFENAVAAALACVNRHAFAVEENPFRWRGVWIPDSHVSNLMLRMDAPLSLPPDSTVTFSGDSVGLALGVCAFSALTNTPAPSDVACTGVLDRSGNLTKVEGTQQKIDSLLVEHPEARRILVARGSDPAVVPPGVAMKDDLDTLESALNVVYEREGGCAGVAKTFALADSDYALDMTYSDVTPVGEVEHRILHFRFSGNNVNAHVLRTLNTPNDRLQPLTTGRRVVIDGAKASWLSLYLGGRLANWATYLAVRQTNDPEAKAKRAVAYVGWSSRDVESLGKRITWELTT